MGIVSVESRRNSSFRALRLDKPIWDEEEVHTGHDSARTERRAQSTACGAQRS